VSAQQVERLLVRKFSHMALAAVAVWSRTPAFGSSRPDAEFDHAARPTTSEVYGDPSVHPQSEDYWGHVSRDSHRFNSCTTKAAALAALKRKSAPGRDSWKGRGKLPLPPK
jgi:hypothetical protein